MPSFLNSTASATLRGKGSVTIISARVSECPFAANFYLRDRLSHFRNHPLDHRLQRHSLIQDFQRSRVLQELRHHVRDVPRLLQDPFRVVQGLRLGRLRLDHLRVARNGRQRVLELVRDSRGQFPQRRQVFLQLHSLLQPCKFRQIRQQADRPADFPLASPDRRNRNAQMPRVPRRRDMFHFFAPKYFPARKALRNQLRQVRVRAQRLAVPPESQPAYSQRLLRRWIRSGNNSRGVHHHEPRRHIPRHFFAQPLRLLRALFFDAMQPFQFFFLLAKLLNHPLHRRCHERRRILRARRARLEFLFLLFPPILK